MFVPDMKQFMLFNQQMLEEAPLKLHHSALVFAPLQCFEQKPFIQDLSDWLFSLPKIRNHSGYELLILEGHSGMVGNVALSFVSPIVLSVTSDITVRLWK